jgi:anti-sigma B factor antagonist
MSFPCSCAHIDARVAAQAAHQSIGRRGEITLRADDAGRRIFEVSSERFGRAEHLMISGELDVATASILEGWLSKATGNGNSEVIVDLEKVTFMDVSGLRALLRAADDAGRRGQRFAVVKADAAVRRVIQLTNTTHLLHSEGPTVPGEPSNRSSVDRAASMDPISLHPSSVR